MRFFFNQLIVIWILGFCSPFYQNLGIVGSYTLYFLTIPLIMYNFDNHDLFFFEKLFIEWSNQMSSLKFISSCKKILFFIGWVSEITEFEADEVLKIKESALANDCFQHKSNANIGVFWQLDCFFETMIMFRHKF